MTTIKHGGIGWRRVMTLRPELVDFAERGFRTRPVATRDRLEACALAFLTGFNAELAVGPDGAPPVDDLPEERRGFAAEGAAMAAALLDAFHPTGGRRLAAVHRAHAERHVYLLHVGTGWALAKLHRRRLGRLGTGDPLLRWLAYDGMGFCQAFFATERTLAGRLRPDRHAGRCPATCAIRYQGLGRSLWFTKKEPG